jgi:hypothetical protein
MAAYVNRLVPVQAAPSLWDKQGHRMCRHRSPFAGTEPDRLPVGYILCSDVRSHCLENVRIPMARAGRQGYSRESIPGCGQSAIAKQLRTPEQDARLGTPGRRALWEMLTDPSQRTKRLRSTLDEGSRPCGNDIGPSNLFCMSRVFDHHPNLGDCC